MDEALRIAIEHLRVSEGFVDHIYLDSVGVETIGYGETRKDIINAYRGKRMSKAEGENLLAERLARDYAAPVRSMITVELNPNQWAALFHFVYNIGVGGFRDSTLRKVINQRQWDQVGPAIMKWMKPPELRKRREKEVALFYKPWTGSVKPQEEDFFLLLAI